MNTMPYDRPKRTEEPAPIRVADRIMGLACIVLAFAFANWVADRIGEPGSIAVVFWATVLLAVWLTGELFVACVRAVSRSHP
jgi:hypothetical protein